MVLPSDLRHVAHHVPPSLILNSPVSDPSTSLFLKQLKTPSLSLFLSSFVCIHQNYLSTDLSGIDQASLFHHRHTHFAIIHPRFIRADFYFYFTCVYE